MTIENFKNEDTAMKTINIMAEIFSCQCEDNISVRLSENLRHPEYDVSHKALISLGLRLCEPLDIIQFINSEKETNTGSDLINISLQAVRKCEALFPCTVKEFSQFFTVSDFLSDEAVLHDCLPQCVVKNRLSAAINNEKAVSYSEGVRRKVFHALKTIETHVSDTCMMGIQDAYNMLKPILSNDVETQVGLVVLADNLLAVPLIHEIWSHDFLMNQEVLECAGTIVMAKVVESSPTILKQLIEMCSVTQITEEKIQTQKSILQNVHDCAVLFPSHSEVVTSSDFYLVQKSIKAVHAFVTRKKRDLSVENIIFSILGGNIARFISDTIQMPYITVARRLSCPAVVEQAILLECASEHKSSSLIGMKILGEVMFNLPYEIDNIELFLLEQDFCEANVKKEKLILERISEVQSKIESPSEVVSLSKHISAEVESDMKHAIKDFVFYSQTATETIVDPAEYLARYDLLDNVQGQACLIELAERLSNCIIVKQILIQDMIENKAFAKHPGFCALKKVLEVYPIQVELVDTYLAEDIFKVDKTRKTILLWQQISSYERILQERLQHISVAQTL